MKKSLALVLALMMILSMFTMGISVSAADMPEDAIAINTADDLAKMEAGKYYYLNADITIGSPTTLEEIDGSSTHANDSGVQVQNDASQPGVEAARITIPAGATLDGNNHTIFYGNYITNPGWYDTNNPFTKSTNWTHEIFALEAGAKITIKNLKLGSQELPVYLHKRVGDNIPGYSANDIPGMFVDAAGADVEWNNVNFYVERYGRGLASQNIGPVITFPKGAHNFTNCTMNVSVMSAGSQYGGWFYNAAASASFNFTQCNNKGFSRYAGYNKNEDGSRADDIYYTGEYWGSVGAGFIHTSYAPVTMTNCINDVNITASYGGVYYLFAGFVGNAGANIEVTACVNNGDFSLNQITIGGGIVGRWNGNPEVFRIINCINNGDIYRSSSSAMTENHGFGGITGHSGAKTTYEVIGCTNYGNIQGVGNIGGVAGFFEGTASVYTVKDCVNYGNITSVGNVEAGGIVGQARMNANITNCKNFGAINAATNNGGILGAGWTADSIKNISNCVNYGTIGSTSTKHAGGIIGIAKTDKMTYNLTNCVNYGKIVTKQYSGGMIAEINVDTTLNMTGCQNYGDIGGVHAVSGFVGHTANGSAVTVTISNSLNAGNVHQSSAAGEGLGGFFGRIAGTLPVITLTNCVNTGTISGSTKASNTYGFFGDTCGQFIGLYTANAGSRVYTGADVADAALVGGFYNWGADGVNKPTLSNCRALGATVLANGAKSLKGWITATRGEDNTVTALKSDKYYYDSNVTLTAPANNGYYGVNVQIADTSVIWGPEHAANQPAALYPYLKSLFKQDFIAGNTELGENAFVTATPMLRGYQMSTDGTSIRFIATINTSNYANVGFVYSLTANGQAIATDATNTATSIWTALNVAGKDSTITTVSATDLGAKYMTGITFNNIPAVGTYKFTVTPVATDANGTIVYTGTAYEITVTHGAVTSVTK